MLSAQTTHLNVGGKMVGSTKNYAAEKTPNIYSVVPAASSKSDCHVTEVCEVSDDDAGGRGGGGRNRRGGEAHEAAAGGRTGGRRLKNGQRKERC
jgi:hypothetical protein